MREQRQRVFAAAIRATHVHIVIAPLREDIKTVVARLKRRSAAAVLARRRGEVGQDGRAMWGRQVVVPRSVWTAGRFPVFIFDECHLVNAIEYVRDHNRRIGLEADPFAWVDPLYPAPIESGARLSANEVCNQLWM